MQILEWYDELLRFADTPIIRLNRAVAVGEADGARAGLAALADIDENILRRDAVAAHLHERNGDLELAARLYGSAAHNAPHPRRARPPGPPGGAAQPTPASPEVTGTRLENIAVSERRDRDSSSSEARSSRSGCPAVRRRAQRRARLHLLAVSVASRANEPTRTPRSPYLHGEAGPTWSAIASRRAVTWIKHAPDRLVA